MGKFLASNVLKTWNEDFIDESTGEVVTIERNEILFERGSYIDDDLAQQINFSIQAEEIKDVEVSNQRRLAAPNQRTGLYPFKVSARIGTKRRTFILQAQDAAKAIEVATDYIELNFRNSFDITDIKLMDNVVILNDRLRKSVEAKEGANEEGAEPDNGEETRDDTKYYKVEAEVAISTENEEEPEKKPYDFIVRTKDVDTAKVVITAWINAKVKERTERDGDERKVIDLSILSASPFACNAIVDKTFCLAYREQEV
ncbi:RNA polymerase subunit sigma [Prevotella sp.]|uniref:RNA polymerase subunit sigma n=1 Tax=Prevotella sp. TaxID=59823 RepID=UPI0025FB467B|nr:RNA polymerase subunit sigma [Prevotella sp.]